jgi:Kinesin motor domain
VYSQTIGGMPPKSVKHKNSGVSRVSTAQAIRASPLTTLTSWKPTKKKGRSKSKIRRSDQALSDTATQLADAAVASIQVEVDTTLQSTTTELIDGAPAIHESLNVSYPSPLYEPLTSDPRESDTPVSERPTLDTILPSGSQTDVYESIMSDTGLGQTSVSVGNIVSLVQDAISSDPISKEPSWVESESDPASSVSTDSNIKVGVRFRAANSISTIPESATTLDTHAKPLWQFYPNSVAYSSVVRKSVAGEVVVSDDQARHYSFSYVASPTSTTGEVYAESVAPLVEQWLGGYHTTYMVYGRTGSGKTTSMFGASDQLRPDSFMARILQRYFQWSGVQVGKTNSLLYSAVELYQEAFYDLLVHRENSPALRLREISCVKTGSTNASTRKQSRTHGGSDAPLREDMAQVYVENSLNQVLSGEAMALALVSASVKQRQTFATAANARSSRSHVIITLTLISMNDVTGEKSTSYMRLVDLAGSERIKESRAAGDRKKEASTINLSLTSLSQVIRGLSRKDPHIPYRNSALTHLLRDSMGGNSQTVILLHCIEGESSVSDTLNTLEFGQRAQNVCNQVRVNKQPTLKMYRLRVEKLEQQVAYWKALCQSRGLVGDGVGRVAVNALPKQSFTASEMATPTDTLTPADTTTSTNTTPTLGNHRSKRPVCEVIVPELEVDVRAVMTQLVEEVVYREATETHEASDSHGDANRSSGDSHRSENGPSSSKDSMVLADELPAISQSFEMLSCSDDLVSVHGLDQESSPTHITPLDIRTILVSPYSELDRIPLVVEQAASSCDSLSPIHTPVHTPQVSPRTRAAGERLDCTQPSPLVEYRHLRTSQPSTQLQYYTQDIIWNNMYDIFGFQRLAAS